MTYPLEYKRDGSGFWENGEAGETLGARKLVYLDTNGVWMLADADAAGEFPVVAITLEAIPNGNLGRILTKGYVGDSSWTWSDLGAPIYATSTAGELSQTQPSDGTKIQAVAMAKESDLILFDTGLNFQASLFYANSNNWEDLRFPLGAIKVGATNPPDEQAYKGGLVLSYPTNQNRIAYVTAQLPHSWVEGTDLCFHLHWVIPTSGAGGGAENVKFDVTHSWANIGSAFPAETTLSFTRDVQNDTADIHLLNTWTDISGAGKTFSSMIIISIERDVSVANNYGDKAYVTEFDIHYKRNRAGTVSETP